MITVLRRIFKISVCTILSCALIISAALPSFAEQSEQPEQAQEGAYAEVLMEAETGQVLYSKNAGMKLPMASVTKITALLIWAEMLEEGTLTLEEKVKASSYASSAEGSVIWLESGEEMTAAELLEAVIISSANDACIALAEHTAGSEAQFVRLMNKKAKDLGMQNTHYVNCVGFDAEGHYSTAQDIAIATAELMKHEVYRGWMLTWLDYLRGGDTQLVNTNKLIRYYEGILGGKTGTTDNAGCCLAVCAERGDMRLVGVVMGCKDDDTRFDSAEKLLDYGFGSFEKFTPEVDMTKLLPITVRHGTATEVKPVVSGRGTECVIKKGRASAVKYEYTFVEEVTAPVERGQFLGEYLVLLDGAEVFRSEIVASEEVEAMSFFKCLWLILCELVTM